ncbi:MAG: ABC transporter permease subunit [Pseudomonadota bacterium]
MAHAERSPLATAPPLSRRLLPWLTALAVLLTVLAGPDWLTTYPDHLVVPLTGWVDWGLTWFAREATIGGVAIQQITRSLAALVDTPIDAVIVVLAEGWYAGAGLNRTQVVPPLPWLALGGAVVLLGYRLGGMRLAATAAIGIAFLVTFGLWHNAMVTLASVLLSAAVAVAIGLAIGIWSYRSRHVETVARAIMNVMQTIPIFAYLIPTLLLFGYGPSAALIATIAYAVPPMVHNTVIALRGVPSEVVEAGIMSGCTPRQSLWQVHLPAALPTLAVGINQVVMMTLNMVIIASMIGAGGLGYDVLVSLRKLDIGAGLEAGVGIVVLAVILDRLTQAAAHRGAGGTARQSRFALWQMLTVWVVVAVAAAWLVPALQSWPESWTLSTAVIWNDLVSWINREFYDPLEAFRAFVLLGIMRPLRDFLMAAPWALVIAAIVAVGARLGGARTAALVGSLATLVLVSGFWQPAMNSLYLILISVVLALLIGFPIGVICALQPRLREAANLFLDTLQTLPTLVYLLPAVMLFRIGDVSAVIAITSYALAPAIRYTMHGISQVPAARLEAAAMSGCSPGQTMLWVRLPSAFPTIVLGINQTIMMALSMLVIAALVGTKDLGQQVLIALNQSRVGQGIVAGICVSALALIADALLKAWAARLAEDRRHQTDRASP